MQACHFRQGRTIAWPKIPGWDYPESIFSNYYKLNFSFGIAPNKLAQGSAWCLLYQLIIIGFLFKIAV